MLMSLTACFLICCVFYLNYSKDSEQGLQKIKYDIDVELQEHNYSIVCQEKIEFQNKCDRDLYEIILNIYPKAFEKKEGNFDKCYWARMNAVFLPGKMEITEITGVENKIESYLIEDTFLRIKLKEAIKDGEKVNFRISYNLRLPLSSGRIGYTENEVKCGNWYPQLAVWQQGKWLKYPYYTIGDPFFSQKADYIVKITLPADWTAAATGNLDKANIRTTNIKELLFVADDVRDFAWTAGKNYSEVVDFAERPIIRSYTPVDKEDFSRKALRISRQAVSIFNMLYGSYPYNDLKISGVDFFQGGMEYPQLVYLSKNIYTKEADDFFEFALVHELAHQWWYGIVGSNQVEEAWLDEALANYSTILYFEKQYDKEKAKNIMNRYVGERNISSKQVIRNLANYENLNDYSNSVYCEGTWVLDDLRNSIGDEQFIKVLKLYFQRYSLKEAKVKDFIYIVEEISGESWHDFFTAKLYN